MHLNSNAVFGSRWFNTDRGAVLLRHWPRLWPSQPHVLSPPQRSRPSAFASPGVALPAAKTQRILTVGSRVSPIASRSFRAIQSRHIASQRKAVSHEVGSGLSRLFAWCGKGRAVIGFRRVQGRLQQVARFPYSWVMPPRSAVLPNPSVKRSANIASHWPSSAGPAAHFALAVQHATLLATAYLKR
jgi:hypothetical protein